MDLILVRHAEAENLGKNGNYEDETRPLTALGVRQAAALAEFLTKMNLKPAHVITSPFLRAVQTAEPLANLLPEPELIECEYLISGIYKPRRLAEFLGAFEGGPIVLVGHMPEIGQYAGWMLESDEPLSFVKGQAVGIHFDEASEKGDGTLAWVVTPTAYMLS